MHTQRRQRPSIGHQSSKEYSFALSSPGLNSGVAKRDRMLLLAAYHIAKHMVNNPVFPSTHVQLILVPRDGAATKFLHRNLMAKDTIGLHFITGKHGDKQIKAVFLRRKSRYSEAESRFTRMGAKPSVSAEPNIVDLDQVIFLLKSQLSHTASSAKFGQLAKVQSVALKEKESKKHYFELACEGSKAKLAKVHDIFQDISRRAQELIDLNINRREEGKRIDPDLRPSKLVKEAASFPVTPKEMELIYRHIGKKASDYLRKWPRDFVLESLARNIGVDVLEYTSKDAVAAIQSMLQLSYLREGQALNPKLEEFDKSMHALLGMIDDVDSEFSAAKAWMTTDPEKWLRLLFKLADQRMKILQMLKDMQKKAEVFHHEAYHQKQLLLILANLSANLCRISRSEIEAWGGFLSDSGVQSAFRASKELKPVKRRIESFISRAEDERDLVADFETAVTSERTAFKERRDELNKSISDSIKRLEKISPTIAGKLASSYQSLLSHLPYKQGEVVSPFIETAYFPSIEFLLSLQGKMQEANFAQLLDRHKSDYSGLFELFYSKKELEEEIMQDISNLLYAQTRAFDLAVSSDRLRSKSLGDDDIEVKYWVSQRNSGTSEEPLWGEVLNLEFLGSTVQIGLRQSSPLEQQLAFSDSGAKKPVDEALYGRQYSIKDVIGEAYLSGDLGDIYSGFFAASQNSPELFQKVKDKLTNIDLGTAHFLSTLADEGNYSGLVTNVLGNLKPSILSSGNSDFPDLLRLEYPGIEKDAGEVQDYIRIGIAKRVVRWLHANLPYYMKRYAEIVASEAD